jgi:hypothetical protein
MGGDLFLFFSCAVWALGNPIPGCPYLHRFFSLEFEPFILQRISSILE